MLLLALAARPTGAHAPHVSRAALLRRAAAASAAAVQLPDVAGAIPPLPSSASAPAPAVLYTPPSIKGASTPEALALAEHLSKTGARFYGAYWCSFCFKQRAMFGAGGSRALPYVECAEDGFGADAAGCRKADVSGYPMWVIGGKSYGGMRTLRDLQALSGFDSSVTFPEYVPPPSPARPPPPPGGYKPPPVEGASTAQQLALAKHLKASGAQFFGAYWCKYCGMQRTLFGASGAGALPYVECAADGSGADPAACRKGDVAAYPTWQIGGQLYSGMKSVDELARLSGFALGATGGGSAAGKAADNAWGLDLTPTAPVISGENCDLPAAKGGAAGADCN